MEQRIYDYIDIRIDSYIDARIEQIVDGVLEERIAKLEELQLINLERINKLESRIAKLEPKDEAKDDHIHIKRQTKCYNCRVDIGDGAIIEVKQFCNKCGIERLDKAFPTDEEVSNFLNHLNIPPPPSSA